MASESLDARLEAIETMDLDALKARLERVKEFINEDDGPARWFYEARVEYRHLVAAIERLEGVTK